MPFLNIVVFVISWVKFCLDYEACTILTDGRLIGTEAYLTKIDRTHTTGFMASYGFPRGLVYIPHEQVLNAKFKP